MSFERYRDDEEFLSTPVRFVRGRQSDDALKLTLDRKVSPRGTYQKSRNRWIAQVPNSFGLPAGDSCPGKTPFCESCYAVSSEQSAGVHDLVDHNFRLLTEAGTVEGMTSLLTGMIDVYVAEADHINLPPAERIFRIHWDGDFFSEDYARAWAETVRAYPDITFFAYTRSFVPPVNVVPTLSGIENLSLYLSADEWNIEAAQGLVREHPGVVLARCAVDYSHARELAADRPSLICPENAGKIPLMSDGKGACVSCQLCTKGSRDVLFSTSRRENLAFQLSFPIGEAALARPGGHCANPECCEPLPPQVGKGRPQKWCKPKCRWDVYRRKQTIQKLGAIPLK